MMRTASFQDTATAFKSGACRTISHQKRDWGLVRADLVRRTGLKKEETAIQSDRHLFLLNLKGDAEQGEYFIDGKPAAFVRRKPGSVLFIPANRRWTGWETGEQSAAYLAISVDPKLSSDLAASDAQQVPLTHSLGLDDPILTHAAWRIGEEMRDKNPLTTLLIESYVRTMLVQMCRRERYAVRERKTGGLSPAALNRVLEKINDDPAAELSLEQLAQLAGLSMHHFCRAFKESVGCAPYTFVLRQRIQMAQNYLQFSDMSVTEIAFACGFSGSSHFSNTFKREVGVTPLSFRTP